MIVVFDDLECPYCARFHLELLPDTLKRYEKRVRVVYKDFPLVEIHPWALHASINAGCLAAQDTAAYWSYIGKIHAHYTDFSGDQRRLPQSFKELDKLAKTQASGSVNQGTLDSCIQKQDQSAVTSFAR